MHASFLFVLTDRTLSAIRKPADYSRVIIRYSRSLMGPRFAPSHQSSPLFLPAIAWKTHYRSHSSSSFSLRVSSMSYIDKIHPNAALASAAALYPLLFRLINPSTGSASRFMKSREAISVTHCVLIVSAVCYELRRQQDKWFPPSLHSGASYQGMHLVTEKVHSGRIDLIEASPPFSNAIIAFECGYLLQDFAILILSARLVAPDSRARSGMARNINWRVLGWHHLGIATALGLYHYRALHGQAKGSLVILMMLLMNVS